MHAFFLVLTPDSKINFLPVLHNFSIDPEAAAMFANPDTSVEALNSLDWAGNPLLATALQNSVGNSSVIGYCSASDVRSPS